MPTTETLIQISAAIEKLADKYATQIGWGSNLKKFRDTCLYCTRHCHYSRYPEVQKRFWSDVWEMLLGYGIDPEPIQKALEQKILEIPWDTTVAYSPKDVFDLIAQQLEAKEP